MLTYSSHIEPQQQPLKAHHQPSDVRRGVIVSDIPAVSGVGIETFPLARTLAFQTASPPERRSALRLHPSSVPRFAPSAHGRARTDKVQSGLRRPCNYDSSGRLTLAVVGARAGGGGVKVHWWGTGNKGTGSFA